MNLYDTPALFVRRAKNEDYNAIPPKVERGSLAPGANANGRQSGHSIPSTGTPKSEPLRAVEQTGRIIPSSVTIPEKPAQPIYLAHELASDDASRNERARYLTDPGRAHDNEQDLAAPVDRQQLPPRCQHERHLHTRNVSCETQLSCSQSASQRSPAKRMQRRTSNVSSR
jgi:hypothetical protein